VVDRGLEEAALRKGLPHDGGAGPPSSSGRIRFLAVVFSVAVHLIVLATVFWPYAAPPPHTEPPPLLVSLTEAPMQPGLPRATEVQTEGAPEINLIQPTLPHPVMPEVVTAESEPLADSNLLSESQLAGAMRAGEGGAGGGGCDTGRLVQEALRRDALVHTAVADARLMGKAILLWNGDWVRSSGQEGKGLAAVREAVMWEVAFAPRACREARMHGLVLLSLAEGGTRFAIGGGDWRWSDLLGLRGQGRL